MPIFFVAKKCVLAEVLSHRVRVYNRRTANRALEIQNSALVTTTERIECSGADLTSRVQIGTIRHGTVIPGDPEHVRSMIEPIKVTQRRITRVCDPDAVA